MTNYKLTWQEISTQYNQEWIELIDYEWLEEERYPRSGTVRVHANSRKEFDRLVASNAPVNSAYIYVGRTDLPINSFLRTYRVLAVE